MSLSTECFSPDKIQQIALSRGVEGVRRKLSPRSFPLIKEMFAVLEREIKLPVQLFEPSTLAVTCVGYRRFTRRHKINGPATADIARHIRGVNQPIIARLGGLSLFGACDSYKLGFTLDAKAISSEENAFMKEFLHRKFQLGPQFGTDDGRTNPHMSIAVLKPCMKRELTEERLQDLDASINRIGCQIRLLPPVFMPDHKRCK